MHANFRGKTLELYLR